MRFTEKCMEKFYSFVYTRSGNKCTFDLLSFEKILKRERQLKNVLMTNLTIPSDDVIEKILLLVKEHEKN